MSYSIAGWVPVTDTMLADRVPLNAYIHRDLLRFLTADSFGEVWSSVVCEVEPVRAWTCGGLGLMVLGRRRRLVSLPLNRCLEPGCAGLTQGARCDTHGGVRRGAASKRGYGYRWDQRAKDFKRRHPICSVPSCTQPTHVANHKTPRRVLIAQGVQDPDQDRYLESLCRHHNAVRTGEGL